MRKLPLFLFLVLLLALVVVPSAAAFRFTDGTRNTPSGITGQPYFHKIEFAGGCKGVSVRLLSGSLPPGISIVGSVQEDTENSNWRFEGTQNAAGQFNFWLEGKNICQTSPCDVDPRDCTQEPFTINVGAGLAIDNGSVPNATVGQPYPSTKLTASGGGTQQWSVASGTLPPGIGLGTDGTLSGTVPAGTPKGDFAFTARVSDGNRSATKAYTLAVRATLAITPVTEVPPAEVGRPFTLPALTATGGSESYTWSVAPGTTLPAGLTLDPATRTLAGTPTVAGTFPVKLLVTDTEARTATLDLPIEVASKLAIATKRLRAGRVGKPYSVTFRTAGGVEPLAWKLKSFKPAGLIQWDKETGTLSWTPKKARPVTITVRVGDSLKALATQTFRVEIKAAPKKKKKPKA
jgi:large repetitive protein